MRKSHPVRFHLAVWKNCKSQHIFFFSTIPQYISTKPKRSIRNKKPKEKAELVDLVTCMKIIKKIKHGYESIIYHQQRIHGVKREALYILLILNLCQLMRDRAVCFYLAAVWNDCLQVHSTIHGFCNFLSFNGLLFIHTWALVSGSWLPLFLFPFFFSHHLPIWYFEWN